MRQRNVAADRTRSNQRVVVIDPNGFDLHQHIAGPCLWNRYILLVEDIEAAERPDCHCMHGGRTTDFSAAHGTAPCL